MNVKDIWWYYVARDFVNRYWENAYEPCPILVSDKLDYNRLGDFNFIPEDMGFETIVLNGEADLSPEEMAGVLLHEMCHLVVLKKHGPDVEAHGHLWQLEMRRAGFEGIIDEYTDGTNRFSKQGFEEVIALHNHLRSNPDIDIDEFMSINE